MRDTTNLRRQRLSLMLDMRPFSPQHRLPIEALESRQLMSAGLTGAFVGNLPRTLPAAGVTDVVVQLKNAGTSTALEPVTLQVFASPTSTASSSEILLATKQANLRLGPRASVNQKLPVPSPVTLLSGRYFLLAAVDGAVVTAAPVNIQAPFSDLVAGFAKLPSKPVEIDGYSAGRRVATVDVTNDGNVPLQGKVNLSLYLSANNALDANASLLASISNAAVSLKPNRSKAIRFEIAVPPGTAIGGYFLLAKVEGVGALAAATTTNSLAVSSRRIAVVGQLPAPININVNVFSTGAGAVGADTGADVGEAGSDAEVCDNGGGTSYGDASSADDSGTTSAGSTSDNAGGGGSSDAGTAADASDDGDTSDYSSGGDF